VSHRYIDAFLRRAHRYGLAANNLTVSELFNSIAQDFFQQNQIASFCVTWGENLESSITPSWTSVPAFHACL